MFRRRDRCLTVVTWHLSLFLFPFPLLRIDELQSVVTIVADGSPTVDSRVSRGSVNMATLVNRRETDIARAFHLRDHVSTYIAIFFAVWTMPFPTRAWRIRGRNERSWGWYDSWRRVFKREICCRRTRARNVRIIPQCIFRRFNYSCNCSDFNVVFSENHFRNVLVELERENTSLRYNNNEQKQTVRLHIQ